MTVKTAVKERIRTAEDVAHVMTEILNFSEEQDRHKEHLWTIGLNSANEINYVELVSLGTLTETSAHPREIFKIAIMKNSVGIIVCHNHPSGRVKPSSADDFLTQRLKKAGEIIGIELLDHVIISYRGAFFSYASQSELWPKMTNGATTTIQESCNWGGEKDDKN